MSWPLFFVAVLPVITAVVTATVCLLWGRRRESAVDRDLNE